MRKLIETLAQAASAHPELDSFREALFQVIEIEDEPLRVALGFGATYVEITDDKIQFVCGSDRVTVEELARIKSLTDDLRSRLLLPFTEGTDEDFDVDKWVDGNPAMPNDVVGGWETGGQIDDNTVGESSTWSSYKIAIELDEKLSKGVIGNTPPVNEVTWFEPNAIAPQPWIYKSNNWYSSVVVADFPVPTVALATVVLSKLIPSRVPRIFVENIYAQLRSNGSGNISTDYYEMRIRVYSRAGVATDLLQYNNQGQAIGSSKFSNTQPLIVIENAAYLEFQISRTGVASTLNLTTSASIDIRYGR